MSAVTAGGYLSENQDDVAVESAIILAGGLGMRLRDVVSHLPKPMAPVNGRPFLEYQIDYWIGQGIRRFVLSVGYRREVIMENFGDDYRGARIEYAIEETPLGTGGGLLRAINKLGDRRPFLLLNGDTFFEVDLQELTDFHVKCRSDWTLSLFRTREATRYMGVQVNDDGRIVSLRSENTQAEKMVNGGVYLVAPDILRSSTRWATGKVSVEDDILPTLLADGARLFAHVCNRRFIDIGVPDDYFRSARILGT